MLLLIWEGAGKFLTWPKTDSHKNSDVWPLYCFMTFYTYSWTCTLKTMVYFSMIMCHVIGPKLHRIGLKSFLKIFNEWFDHHIFLIAFIRRGWFACKILHLQMSINYRWLLKWYGLLLIKRSSEIYAMLCYGTSLF